MACVWLSLLVILMTGQVFARDCSRLDSIKNCDHCIQCGGIWCKDPTKELNQPKRCSTPTDDFCSNTKEEARLPNVGNVNDGVVDLWSDTGSPIHVHQAVLVTKDVSNEFGVKGPFSNEPKFKSPTYANSTIKNYALTSFETKISHSDQQTKSYVYYTLRGKPTTDFCPASGANDVEKVSYTLDAGRGDARITYHVPCTCACSSIVERNSAQCNGRGNLSCGICTCEPGWKGEFCEEQDTKTTNQGLIEDCGRGRGDIPEGCSKDGKPVCSNNGNCTCEGKCVCRTDILGYQYFDQHCTDICSAISDCDSCIINPPTDDSYCSECQLMDLYVDPTNKTRLEDKDEKGRNIWIKCIEKASDITKNCDIEYAAMKIGEDAHIMIIDRCKGAVAEGLAGAGVNVVVPTILGVIALVAAATAVAGYMVWKNRGPPLPFAHQDYGNIDAEDCTGENPLYKPPTSSFKNPTYGKW